MDNTNQNNGNNNEKQEYVNNMVAWAEAMEMSKEEMQRPFDMDMAYAQEQEAAAGVPAKMVKPMRIQPASNEDKLYLLLLCIDNGNYNEPIHEWMFVKGRQNAYDTLKTYLESPDIELDAMKSRVLVDSEKVKISHKYSVFAFMRDMKERLAVKDDTSFDINDYYYDEE